MKGLVAAGILAAVALAGLAASARPRPSVVRGAVASPGATPEARGREVYTRYGCALCHGADGRGGLANPNAETDGRVPGVLYVAEGYTEAELKRLLLDGRATIGQADAAGPRPPFRMPGWRGRIRDDELDDLVRYLFSLYPGSAEQKWR